MRDSGPLFLTPDTLESTSSPYVHHVVKFPRDSPPRLCSTRSNPPIPSNVKTAAFLDPVLASPVVPAAPPPDSPELQRESMVQWFNDRDRVSIASRLLSCGLTFLHVKCAFGHERYHRLHCSLDYCPTCGQKGSRVHKRRTVRAKDRLMCAHVLGYLVLTLPSEIYALHLTQKQLSALMRKAWRIVEKYFNGPGGLVYPHFTGNTLGHFQMHINVLFPVIGTDGRGRCDPSTMEAAAKEWGFYLNQQYRLHIKKAIIHYGFSTTKKEKAHKIRYVLRSTFTADAFLMASDADREYYLSLSRFHKARWYGTLSNSKWKKYLIDNGVSPHSYTDGDPHESNNCPIDGTRFKKVDFVSECDIPKDQCRRVDNDLFQDLELAAHEKSGAPNAPPIDRVVISLSSQESSEKLQEKTKVEPERLLL